MRNVSLATMILAGMVPAQTETDVAAARAAIDAWVKSDGRDRDQRSAAAKTIEEHKATALKLLGTRLDAALQYGHKTESTRLYDLVKTIAEDWLEVVEKSEMVYAGQYAVLQPLMPSVGEYYLDLILDTPVEFPSTERWRVVAAVRDLYPKGPGRDALDRIGEMAADPLESAGLRENLTFAMAQWGRRKLIKTRIKDLQKSSRGDDEESAILALRALADIQYGIRDYAVAAVTSREFIARAEKADSYLVPVHYYNAACCMCLSGDRRTALQFLERCLELNKSDKIDPSMRLKRKLFDNDPEIGLARRDPKFAPMVERAFGKKKVEKPSSRKSEGDG